jgi:hypothetical protein
MILYNVTIKIDKSAEEEWLHYMKVEHIPEVMATGNFTGFRMCKLLDIIDDDESTYVFQYECESMGILNNYRELKSPQLQENVLKRFKNKFVAFRTVMEVLNNK